MRLRRLAARSVAALVALGPALAASQPTVAPPARVSGGDIVGYPEIHHPVIGRGGMVVSQNEIAARVGANILRHGGNAVDAAVATAFAEAVTLSRAGNLGGGGYMLVHMAAVSGREASTTAVAYYSAAPLATTPQLLLKSDGTYDRDAAHGFKGVATPGTVAGLWAAHSRFGRLPWRAVVDPAVRLAREGVVLTDDSAQSMTTEGASLDRNPAARAIFRRPDGSPFRTGDRHVQPDLAATLARIRDGGADAFYQGEVGRRLVAGVRAGGGIISEADLAAYRATVSAPIWGSYRGVRIAYMPPTSAGVFLDEVMNVLERFPLRELGWGTAASLHVLAEAMKLAWADRAVFGQPGVTVEKLSDKAYAATRAARIRDDASLTAADLAKDGYVQGSPDTTQITVADAEGDAVTNTFTLSSSFGAGVVAPGTGFLLNDSMGNFAWAKRREEEPGNRPVPGRHVNSTITPLIAFKAGRPWLVTGTPGGGYIVATLAQLLSNVIDHGLNVAEAAERPRINQGGAGAALELEHGFSEDTATLLKVKGHAVKRSNTMGSTQSVMIENGVFLGAPDTRRPDAAAVGVR